jgi:outer membrane protein
MRKSILLAGLFLLFLNATIFAQKFAYIDSETLITLMPETELAQAQFEAQVTELQTQLEEMQVEYNNLYQEYLTNEELAVGEVGKWSKAIKTVKEEELMQLQERIQNFQVTAQTSIEEIQVTLFTPIYDKVDVAVEAVAKEKGYICVFDINNILYINPEKCDDIAVDVKIKLGIVE